MEGKKTERFSELEGVRGIAAVLVVIFHFLVIFYPVLFFGGDFLQHSRVEDNLRGSPFAALFSGSFAVATFFVLSGFVLSIGFFQTGKTSIIRRLAIKRYLRLMPPALASVLLAWVYLTIGLSHTEQLHAISQSSGINVGWGGVGSFWDALYEGTIGAFVHGVTNTSYNSVLWTMQYEFAGSFLVIMLAILFAKSKQRWIVYLIAVVATYNTFFLGFIAGMILADLYANARHLLDRVGTKYYIAGLGFAIFLAAYPVGSSAAGTVYEFLNLPWLSYSQNQSLAVTIAGALVIVGVLQIQKLRALLSTSRMTSLGKHTYSLYLVHQPIIYTFTAAVFVSFAGGMQLGYNLSVLLSIIITIPIIILATKVFYIYVEKPSIHLANYAESVYSGRTEMQLRPKKYYKKTLRFISKRMRFKEQSPAAESELS